MTHINQNFLKLPGGYLFPEISRRVKAFSAQNPPMPLIKLGIGDVTLPLAPAVVEAMAKATEEMGRRETFRGYCEETGCAYDFLRFAIQGSYRDCGVEIADDEIFVSDGAKSDCGNIGDIFSVDNVVAVCDPVYPVYVDTNAMAGLVDFLLHPVAETVDGNEIRFLISGQPDIMDVTVKKLFNFPAGVDVVHIGIQNDLEHHLGVVRAAAAFLIQLSETFKIQALNQGVNHAHRIIFCNILINSLRKKNGLVGNVRTKMYLCHSEILMPKDTESLGNNKAPACESRGFVRKIMKVCILTHLLFVYFYCKNPDRGEIGR